MKRSGSEDGSNMVEDEEGQVHQNAEDQESGGFGDDNAVIFVAGTNPDQWPHQLLQGATAGLAALRQGPAAQSMFFVGPRAKLEGFDNTGIPCKMHWDTEDESCSSLMLGNVYITQSQVLFVASTSTLDVGEISAEAAAQVDWAIGATCIHLHAMTDEPEVAVYLQLSECEGPHHETNTLEVTFTPIDPSSCQSLFDGLCKLVAKHPLQLEDDGEDGYYGGDDGPGFGGGGNFFMGGGGADDLIWAPAAGAGRFGAVIPNDDDEEDETGGDGATEEQRAAMLERLDNLLVVQPEFETQEGQFDDADEDEEDETDPSPQ